MLSPECLNEFQQHWLPHLTDSGLNRLIELLEKDSPVLISGCFNRAGTMGCLATQAAWHDERTIHRHHDAGIYWLSHVVGISPSHSAVIREWDRRAPYEFGIRFDLLEELLKERERRQEPPKPVPVPECVELVSV